MEGKSHNLSLFLKQADTLTNAIDLEQPLDGTHAYSTQTYTYE